MGYNSVPVAAELAGLKVAIRKHFTALKKENKFFIVK